MRGIYMTKELPSNNYVYEMCIENGMEQIVDENTRGNNILDLIFTNESDSVIKNTIQDLNEWMNLFDA